MCVCVCVCVSNAVIWWGDCSCPSVLLTCYPPFGSAAVLRSSHVFTVSHRHTHTHTLTHLLTHTHTHTYKQTNKVWIHIHRFPTGYFSAPLPFPLHMHCTCIGHVYVCVCRHACRLACMNAWHIALSFKAASKTNSISCNLTPVTDAIAPPLHVLHSHACTNRKVLPTPIPIYVNKAYCSKDLESWAHPYFPL